MIKFILSNANHYSTLENKLEDALYFLQDTGEIYKGSESYSKSVIFVDELPEFAAPGKMYVINSTLECKVYNGTKWTTVIPEIKTTLSDEEVCNGLVTGEGVKSYVLKKISDIITEGGVDLNADNVVTTKPITVKGQTLGSYKDGDVIPAGEKLSTILAKQFAKQIPPTYTAPNVRLSQGTANHEAGTLIESFALNSTFNKNDAGDVNKYTLTHTDDGTSNKVVDSATLDSYTFTNITVGDGNSQRFSAVVSYDAGPIKNDNLGEPYPNGSIKAGSCMADITLAGQRKVFYARDNKTAAVANSADVRALAQSSMNPSNGTKLTLNISAGDTRVTFAYPASLRDVTSVISSSLNLDVKGTFVKTNIEVEGANGYKAISYKVYTYIPAIPFASNDTYTVTI